MQIIFPLTRPERNRLKITELEFRSDKTLGIVLTPSDVRRGLKRWWKQGEPNVAEGADVSQGVAIVCEVLVKTHKAQLKAVEEALLDEFETQFANHNIASETELENQQKEAKRHKDTYERRIALKNKQLLEFRDQIKVEREKVQTYHAQFGEIRSHPLNWLQRFMGRLFRIL